MLLANNIMLQKPFLVLHMRHEITSFREVKDSVTKLISGDPWFILRLLKSRVHTHNHSSEQRCILHPII